MIFRILLGCSVTCLNLDHGSCLHTLGHDWSELTFTLEVTVYLEFTPLPAASRHDQQIWKLNNDSAKYSIFI